LPYDTGSYYRVIFSEVDMKSFVIETFSCLLGWYGKLRDVIVV
jgi:hypothetical protein